MYLGMKVRPTPGTVEAWLEGLHDDLVLSLSIGLWLAERTTLIPVSWYFGPDENSRVGIYG